MHTRTALTGLTMVAVLLPGVAVAGTSAIPPIPMGSGSSDECALAKAQFRTTVTAARRAKRTAYHAARDTWLAGTKDERAARRAALAAADTKAERTVAQRVYRVDIADERATRRGAKQDARARFRATRQSAGKDLHRGLKHCGA